MGAARRPPAAGHRSPNTLGGKRPYFTRSFPAATGQVGRGLHRSAKTHAWRTGQRLHGEGGIGAKGGTRTPTAKPLEPKSTKTHLMAKFYSFKSKTYIDKPSHRKHTGFLLQWVKWRNWRKRHRCQLPPTFELPIINVQLPGRKQFFSGRSPATNKHLDAQVTAKTTTSYAPPKSQRPR